MAPPSVLTALFFVSTLPSSPPVTPYAALPPATCTGSLPSIHRLRIATHAAHEPAVSFLAWTPSPATSARAPLPLMGAGALERACAAFQPTNQKHWGFCAQSPRAQRDRYGCDSAAYVAAVDCAFVDPDAVQHERPVVYTHRSSFAVHLTSGAFGRAITPPRRDRLREYPQLAHALGVYPKAPAHVLEQLPRLVHLLAVLPAHVPILLPKDPAGLRAQFLAVLEALAAAGCKLDGHRCTGAQLVRGADGALRPLADVLAALPREPQPGNATARVVWWDASQTYRASRLFFAAEAVHVRSPMPAERPGNVAPAPGWYDLLDEAPCHYKRIQPSWLLQRALVPVFARPRAHAALRVLLVHRAETSARRLLNHAQLERALRAALPLNSSLTVFVGREHALGATISLFANADLVIAPHGAANGFWAFMRPHAAVIEIGYPSKAVMAFPASHYYPFAVSLSLRYYLSIAKEGAYTTAMAADIPDVVQLALDAAAWLSGQTPAVVGLSKRRRALKRAALSQRKAALRTALS